MSGPPRLRDAPDLGGRLLRSAKDADRPPAHSRRLALGAASAAAATLTKSGLAAGAGAGTATLVGSKVVLAVTVVVGLAALSVGAQRLVSSTSNEAPKAAASAPAVVGSTVPATTTPSATAPASAAAA